MKEVDQELFDAIKQGNLDRVQRCLNRGADINVKDNYGKTPLDLAREEGHMEIVNILGGAKPKVVGRGLSNVYFSSEKAQELDKKYSGDELETAKKDIVEYLKYRGYLYVHILRGKDRGMSAWHYVLVNPGKNEMFQEQSKTGSVDAADYGKILYSGWGQDLPQSIIDEMDRFSGRVSNNLFLIKEEREGKSVYHYALVNPDKKEVFQERSKAGSALVREIEDYGRILYSGWGQDPPESISDRIERAYFCMDERDLEGEFANLSVKDSNALHGAARNGELEAVRYFIRKEVGVNGVDKNGWTSLHHAAYGGSLGVVKYLVNNGANFHTKDTICDRKPIHIAAREGNTGIVKLFLSKGVRVNDADKNSWMPLHYAAWSGCLGVTELLINEGANIHAKEVTRGKKPIHVAAGKGHTNVVELFLSSGIGIDDTDKEGRTSLYCAAQKGHLEVMKFLIGKGANIHAENTYGIKPIYAAALEGHREIIEFLLSKGASVDNKVNNCCTLLHAAAREGQLKAVEFLIEKGADINAKNNYSKIPSDLARENGHMEIVNMLSGTKKKSQLLETTSGNPELYLSSVTVSNQPKRSPSF